MNVGHKSLIWNWLSALGLPGRIVALATFATVTWLLMLPLAYAVSGGHGIAGASIAAFICLIGGEAGLLLAGCFSGPAAAMNGALAAMMVRMAIPLAGGVTLHMASPWIASSGMIFYLLAFYMIDLLAETLLMVAGINTDGACTVSAAKEGV